MLSKKFKPGDLVTFNCAGSKGKTLALVIDIDDGVPMRNAFGELTPCIPGWIEVQWIQVSRWMPRVHTTETTLNYRLRSWDRPQPGDIAKHPECTAFEVVQ